jgi:hypothetical protein
MAVKAIGVFDGELVWAEAAYYGNCSRCGRPFEEVLNVGPAHWQVCHTDRVAEWIGENIFGGWRHETEDDWARNKAILDTYEDVEAIMAWEEDDEPRKDLADDFEDRR